MKISFNRERDMEDEVSSRGKPQPMKHNRFRDTDSFDKKKKPNKRGRKEAFERKRGYD